MPSHNASLCHVCNSPAVWRCEGANWDAYKRPFASGDYGSGALFAVLSQPAKSGE